jgi:hypothetical protein
VVTHHRWIRLLTSIAARMLLVLLICGAPISRKTVRQARQFFALMRSPDWHVERTHGDGDSIVVTAYRVFPNGRRAFEAATFEFTDPVLAWLPFGIVIGLFVALLAGIFPFFRTAIDFLSNPFRFYALQWAEEAAQGRSPFLKNGPTPWIAIIAWNLMGVLLWFVAIPSLIDQGHTFLVLADCTDDDAGRRYAG